MTKLLRWLCKHIVKLHLLAQRGILGKLCFNLRKREETVEVVVHIVNPVLHDFLFNGEKNIIPHFLRAFGSP